MNELGGAIVLLIGVVPIEMKRVELQVDPSRERDFVRESMVVA